MRYLLVSLLLVLTACQTYPTLNEDSPYSAVPRESRLILHKAIALAPEQTRVYLQHGGVVPFENRDAFYAHCRIELSPTKQIAPTIEPDEFVIYKVTQQILVSDGPPPGQLLAGGSGSDKDGIDSKLYARILHLRSARQPGVLRLRCQRWDDLAFSKHLSISEIRETLGNTLTLQLAKQAG